MRFDGNFLKESFMNNLTIYKPFQALIANCIVAGMLSSNPATAAIIYDQPGSVLPGLTTTASDNVGRSIYDDFQLASDFTLTRIEWTGGFVSSSAPPDTIASPPLFFNGGIIEDQSGEPTGAILAGISNPIEVFLGSNSVAGLTTVVNRYSIDLATPVTLNGSQPYWLGINALFNAVPEDSTLEWHWAFGANGNGQALVFIVETGDLTPVLRDFSFTLIGSPIRSVPEPGMLLLLGVGLVAFCLNRRSSRLNAKRE